MRIKLYQACKEWMGWIENGKGVIIAFVKDNGSVIWDW